jgi:hypothetical protein
MKGGEIFDPSDSAAGDSRRAQRISPVCESTPTTAGANVPNLQITLFQRLMLLWVGLLIGAVFSLWVATSMASASWGIGDRAFAWAIVMGGPVVGTWWGMAGYHASVGIGWLGLFLIPAHPYRPHPATACVTFLGFAIWFFAGFVTFMVAAWGA